MRARAVEGLDPDGPFREGAARIVAVRLAELRELAPAALEPAASTAQHDLRIAAKRLRYGLEVAAPCLDGAEEAERLRSRAKDLQSVLGDLHDCDVMLPRADGIGSLVTLLEGRRGELFERFRKLWEEEGTQNLISGAFLARG